MDVARVILCEVLLYTQFLFCSQSGILTGSEHNATLIVHYTSEHAQRRRSDDMCTCKGEGGFGSAAPADLGPPY
jgi:hypothetical protein